MSENEYLSIKDIEKAIPHRYPFLFIDAVTVLEPGARAEGHKMVSGNEWFFPGHFPKKPLLPGVIMVEALAQLAAVCFLSETDGSGGLGVLTGLDGMKFRRQVTPGEKLDLRVELDRRRGPFIRVRGQASVDGEMAVEGLLSFSLIPGEE